MKSLIMAVCSGVSADGIDVTILEDGKTIYEYDYRYGYDASYDRSWATEKKPYIGDIIANLAKEYNIDELYIKPGIHKFKGIPANKNDLIKGAWCYINDNAALIAKYKGIVLDLGV